MNVVSTLALVATLAHASATAHKKHHKTVLPQSISRVMKAHPGGTLVAKPMIMGKIIPFGVKRPQFRLAPLNTYYGNCGASYLYTYNAGGGYMQETFGLNLNYAIINASAVVSWSNSRTGGHNAFDQAWGVNLNGNENAYHRAYTNWGSVYSVMYAKALIVTPFGWTTCATPLGQPYSITYVY